MGKFKKQTCCFTGHRDIPSAEQLEEVYAPFGFDAESFSGEEYINQDVLAAYKKDSAAYKVLALTTCASDYSNARTVIITLIQE